MSRFLQVILGVLAALAVAAGLLFAADRAGILRRHRAAEMAHVAEDASGPLRVIAIHYAPSADDVALDIWRQLFTALPASVRVEVAVTDAADFERLAGKLREWKVPALERFVPVVVGAKITTWSRDRFAAMEGNGDGSVLAPPRIETAFAERAGDWTSPFALAQAVWGHPPAVADFVFEGGDLASTPRYLFVDANLRQRNLARADATRERLMIELARHFKQEIVWLGDATGEVPQHHIMMYAVPLDDTTVAVGDVNEGLRLLATEPAGGALDVAADEDEQAKRFDRAAALIAARGFKVVRFPAIVRAGDGSYVTYTNALFDLVDGKRVVYLPTYELPKLDEAAAERYRSLGYVVVGIDVAPIYGLNGSLGCLVNVMSRGSAPVPK